MDSTTWKNFRILSATVWVLFIIGMVLVGSKLWMVVGASALVMDQIIGHIYAKHLENLEEVRAIEEIEEWENQYDEDEDEYDQVNRDWL